MLRYFILSFICATAIAGRCGKVEVSESWCPGVPDVPHFTTTAKPVTTAPPTTTTLPITTAKPTTMRPTPPPTRPPFIDLLGLANYFLSPLFPTPSAATLAPPTATDATICPACFLQGSMSFESWKNAHLYSPVFPPAGKCLGPRYPIIFQGQDRSLDKCCCFLGTNGQ